MGGAKSHVLSAKQIDKDQIIEYAINFRPQGYSATYPDGQKRSGQEIIASLQSPILVEVAT